LNTALCIFAFNRPEKLAKLLDDLRLNRDLLETPVNIFVDAARNPREAKLVEQVLNQVKNFAAEFPATAAVIVREENFGLARNVKMGISETLASYDSAIVLEDDLRLATNFLSEMKRMLIEHAEHKDVFSISGFSNLASTPPKAGLVASWYFSSWGWATWADRWSEIDWRPRNPKYLEWARLDLFGSRRNRKMLRLASAQKIDSWAIYAFLHCIFLGKVNLRPDLSLVSNDGMDGSGTHGDSTALFSLNSPSTVGFGPSRRPPQNTFDSALQDVFFYLKKSSPYTLVTSLFRMMFFLPALIYFLKRR
jgi:hypothetical protein